MGLGLLVPTGPGCGLATYQVFIEMETLPGMIPFATADFGGIMRARLDLAPIPPFASQKLGAGPGSAPRA